MGYIDWATKYPIPLDPAHLATNSLMAVPTGVLDYSMFNKSNVDGALEAIHKMLRKGGSHEG